MSVFSQFTTGAIKSTQRGVLSVASTAGTATATITSVDTSKTQLRFLGNSATTSSQVNDAFFRVELTNSTTITITRSQSGNTNSGTVSWELTEYY